MARILYLQASPRIERSYSRNIADAFIAAILEQHPGEEIITKDLFAMDLPPLDGLAVQAKYTILHGENPSGEEKKAWGDIEAVIEEFKSADKYVIASPMWNFGIPYRLKQYFDIIVQPGYTFSYSPEEGYKGLIQNKPVLVVSARGGAYPEDSESARMDFQKPYLEAILRFIGLEQIEHIVMEPTLMEGPEAARNKRVEAIGQARKLARVW
jgi:FMN-dependent NADH-azoreductase